MHAQLRGSPCAVHNHRPSAHRSSLPTMLPASSLRCCCVALIGWSSPLVPAAAAWGPAGRAGAVDMGPAGRFFRRPTYRSPVGVMRTANGLAPATLHGTAGRRVGCQAWHSGADKLRKLRWACKWWAALYMHFACCGALSINRRVSSAATQASDSPRGGGRLRSAGLQLGDGCGLALHCPDSTNKRVAFSRVLCHDWQANNRSRV